MLYFVELHWVRGSREAEERLTHRLRLLIIWIFVSLVFVACEDDVEVRRVGPVASEAGSVKNFADPGGDSASSVPIDVNVEWVRSDVSGSGTDVRLQFVNNDRDDFRCTIEIVLFNDGIYRNVPQVLESEELRLNGLNTIVRFFSLDIGLVETQDNYVRAEGECRIIGEDNEPVRIGSSNFEPTA